MKILKFCLIVLFTLVLFSCKKETENLSRSTYYVAFEIKGDNPAIVQVGEPYVDAGFIATEHGKAFTGKVTTKTNVNYKEMGIYQVEYSATNIDGLESRAIREVIVCNPGVTTDIGGVWNVSSAGTYRSAAGTPTYYGGAGYTVRITKLAPGFFSVSDYLAGWYAVRAGYGSGYAFTGNIALNEDNTISYISGKMDPWGMGMQSFNNAKYDPIVNTVKWEYGWNNWIFYVTLTK